MYACILLTWSEEKRYFVLKTKYKKKKRIKQAVTFSQEDYKLKQFSKFCEDFGQNSLNSVSELKVQIFCFHPFLQLFALGILVGAVCKRARLLQSCRTLRDPMYCSPPGSSIHGILQARILEGVAMPSSGGSSQPGYGTVSQSFLHWQASSLHLAPSGKPSKCWETENYQNLESAPTFIK